MTNQRVSNSCFATVLAVALLIVPPAAMAQAVDLLAVFEQAEQSDPVYRAAIANAAAIAEGVPQARALLLFPTLSLSGSISRSRQDTQTSGTSFFGAGGVSTFTGKSYSINLTQPVFHFDRIVSLKQADQRVQQAQYELSSVQQDLVLRVAQRYFEVLAAQDNVDVAHAETEALQRQLEQAQQRFEVGLIAITDIQDTRSGADRAVANEILAQNQYDNAREALREVTLVYHPGLVRLGENLPLTPPEPNDIDQWTAIAQQQNLALASARIAAEIAHEDIRLQYAGHLPTVDVTGRHGFQTSGGRFGDSETTSGEIGVQLSVPIYEGGRVMSRTREATYRHTEALERLEQQIRLVHRQSRESFLGILSTISSIKALNQAVISAQTALESTQAGFEVGTRTGVDVVTAERNLSQARRDYARARYDYVLNIFTLKQAAGTLSQDDIVLANTWLAE